MHWVCRASHGSMGGTDGHARLCSSAPLPSQGNGPCSSPVPAARGDMLPSLARRRQAHRESITVLRGDAGPAPLGIARLAALKLGGGRAARAGAARDLRNHNRRVRRSGGRVPAAAPRAKSQHSTRLNVAAEQADGQLGPRTCSARVSAAVGSSQQSSQRPPSMACHLGHLRAAR